MNKIIKWLKQIWRVVSFPGSKPPLKKKTSSDEWKEFDEIKDELYQRLYKMRRDKFLMHIGFTFLASGNDAAESSIRKKHISAVSIELPDKTICLYNVLDFFSIDELKKGYPLKFDDNVVPFSSDKK